MEKVYQVNFRNILQSNKECLIFVTVTMALAPIKFYFKDISFNDIYPFFLLFILAFCVPTFYLFFTFYSVNRKTVFTIDSMRTQVSIRKDNDHIVHYKMCSIKHVDRVVSIFFKNKLDNKGRWPTPWTGYGFIRITFDSGHKIILTSLMVDPFEFPIEVNTTCFKFLPDLSNQIISTADEEANAAERKERRVKFYEDKFRQLSEEELNRKLQTKRLLENEAKMALDNIINRRAAD